MIIEMPDSKEVPYYCSSCSKCCNGNVPIHPAEAFELSKYAGIPIEELVQEERSKNHFWLNYDKNNLACMFLEDGQCSIYDRRPLVCRKFPVNFAVVFGTDAVTAMAHNPWNESCIGLPEKNESNRKLFSENDLFYIIEKSIIHRAVRLHLNGVHDKVRIAKKAYSLLNSFNIERAIDLLKNEDHKFILI